MKHERWLLVASHIAAAGVGVVGARTVVPRSGFVLDEKINLVQLGTLITTVAISVAFFRRIERQKYSDKLRKDGLLEEVNELKLRIAVLYEIASAEAPSYPAVVGQLKRCRLQVGIIRRFAAALGLPVEPDDLGRVLKMFAKLDRLLTYTPREPIPSDAPLRVEGQHIVMSLGHRSQVTIEMDATRDAVLVLHSAIVTAI